MSFERIDGILNINFDNVSTLALASLIIVLSYAVKKRSKFMNKYCIPAPILGGLIFSVAASLLWTAKIAAINVDVQFQDLCLVAFFTTIGLGSIVDRKFLKMGGKLLVMFYILEGICEIIQSGIALGGAGLLGMDYPYGFLCGTVTMLGGVSGGVAWGSKLEALGYAGAQGVGIAAGTFGLIAGGILASPIGKGFIDKYNLRSTDEKSAESSSIKDDKSLIKNLSAEDISKQIALLFSVMALGTLLGVTVMNNTSLYLLPFVGSLFVGVVVANVNRKVKFMEINNQFLDKLGSVCLNIFLTMAFLTLKVWELVDLVGPVFIILAAQIVAMFFYSKIMFRALGKSYDAAIMTTGFVGHGLGSMVTAVASMDTLTEKYGSSTKAYLIVPLVGALLIDFVAVPCETFCFNLALKLMM